MRVNESRKKYGLDSKDPAIRSVLRPWCGLDQQLYEFARMKFSLNLSRCGTFLIEMKDRSSIDGRFESIWARTSRTTSDHPGAVGREPGKAAVPAWRQNKPVLYLHVGMHKTGTTAIQAAMYASRRQLARRGIYYPGFEQNHSVAIGSLFSEEPEKIIQNMRRGRTSREQVAEYNADCCGTSPRVFDGILEEASDLGREYQHAGCGRCRTFETVLRRACRRLPDNFLYSPAGLVHQLCRTGKNQGRFDPGRPG